MARISLPPAEVISNLPDCAGICVFFLTVVSPQSTMRPPLPSSSATAASRLPHGADADAPVPVPPSATYTVRASAANAGMHSIQRIAAAANRRIIRLTIFIGKTSVAYGFILKYKLPPNGCQCVFRHRLCIFQHFGVENGLKPREKGCLFFAAPLDGTTHSMVKYYRNDMSKKRMKKRTEKPRIRRLRPAYEGCKTVCESD